MLIADHAPVYPKVALAQNDKLHALAQAAAYLHEALGVELAQARASLLASAANDGTKLTPRAAMVHATDPNCTRSTVLIVTLRRAIMWTALAAPIDYLIVWRVPQLTTSAELAALREQTKHALMVDATSLDRWRDDPVGLGWLAADMMR